jgi:hypothetical protein
MRCGAKADDTLEPWLPEPNSMMISLIFQLGKQADRGAVVTAVDNALKTIDWDSLAVP